MVSEESNLRGGLYIMRKKCSLETTQCLRMIRMTSLFSPVMVYGFENLKMFKGWMIEDFSGELCIFLGGADVFKGIKMY